MTRFLITSITMLRERITGTLERQMTLPPAKADLLLGYGIAFALVAAVQALAAAGVALRALGLDVDAAVIAGGALLALALGAATLRRRTA